MMQVQTVQPQMTMPVPTAQYNAVNLQISNPSVNVPGNQPVQAPVQAPVEQSAVTSPIYGNIPTASVYEMPKASAYPPQAQAPAAQPMPSVPQPVIITPVVNSTPTAPATAAPAPVAQAPVAPVAPVQPVEVKAPEEVKPIVDVNAFITKLTSSDYEQQATAMESIADLAQNSPKQATALLDVKVIDTLLGIMQTDSSKLVGPTPAQLQIREKIMTGKPVTEAETVEANKITPMELAERNKQYSIYTVAILQKLYGSEIEKINSTVVPMTELPGAAGIVEQVKNNPNPMVRASGIDALSYIQRPEYKQDLSTLFTVAKNDKDVNVQQAATKALEKLAQVSTPASTTPAATAATPAAAPASTQTPEAVKPETVKKA